MIHLAAYFEAVDASVNTGVNPVQDDYLDIINNRFRLRRDMNLVAAYAGSATLNRARLDSPSIRLIGNPQIRPINAVLLPPNDLNLMDVSRNPFLIRAGEELELQVTAAPGMTENLYAGLWLMERFVPAPRGDVYAIRFTSTTAAVANVWTSITITLEQSLPMGRYSLVGSEMTSTNAILHRWIVPDRLLRPGFTSTAAIGSRTHKLMYEQGLGEWGQFFSTSLPIPQVLCNAADNAHTGFMYVTRLSADLPRLAA